MKRKEICTAIASSILLCLCCACGNQNTVPETDIAPDETVPNENDATLLDAEEQDTKQDTAIENNTDADNETSAISIKMQTEESSENAEDGTCIYTSSYRYPTVSIDGNEDAAAKINADIQKIVDSFRSSSENSPLQYAKEDYETRTAETEADYPFTPYADEVQFATARSDSNVISFVIMHYTFSGGAHGYIDTMGINYSAQTGEIITFSDLSEDASAFHADTLSYNQKLAASDSYRGRLFSEDSISNGELESVLYADGAWYLSTTGLVFISVPYALGPYAAGTIEFIIPYSDLDEMGFKKAYSYSGKLTMKLQAQEQYSIDVNGDGTKDSFQFYTEYDDANTGAELAVHFIINDTDFAQETSDELKERFVEYSWMDSYAIYDLDESDDALDFVFFDYVEENDIYVMYNYFYRYEKDGSLTYLGKTQGDIYDPTDDVSNLSF